MMQIPYPGNDENDDLANVPSQAVKPQHFNRTSIILIILAAMFAIGLLFSYVGHIKDGEKLLRIERLGQLTDSLVAVQAERKKLVALTNRVFTLTWDYGTTDPQDTARVSKFKALASYMDSISADTILIITLDTAYFLTDDSTKGAE